MGRPRLPTAVQEAKGAFAKDPKRGRERELEPEGVGDIGIPPKGLTAQERKVWDEVVAVAPWLTGSDRHDLVVFCRLEAEWRKKGSEFLAAKIGQLRGALTSLGLTPSSRSSVKATVKKPTAPGSEFLQ